MNKLSVQDQLLQLKAMTVRTGAIHEAQALQLRTWPLLIPGVKSCETVVDVESQLVTFNCATEGKFKKTKTAKEWMNRIDGFTKLLLWPETKTKFVFNGKGD